mmetsp:Transcript_105424/g.251067  ORF Transcript_105424/g.251067 Transcript_105424/m.251067 type:complete len:220 (+) Transcript_105424:210-869(+)
MAAAAAAAFFCSSSESALTTPSACLSSTIILDMLSSHASVALRKYSTSVTAWKMSTRCKYTFEDFSNGIGSPFTAFRTSTQAASSFSTLPSKKMCWTLVSARSIRSIFPAVLTRSWVSQNARSSTIAAVFVVCRIWCIRPAYASWYGGNVYSVGLKADSGKSACGSADSAGAGSANSTGRSLKRRKPPIRSMRPIAACDKRMSLDPLLPSIRGGFWVLF